MEIALCYPVPEAYRYSQKLGCRYGYLDICWPRIQPEPGVFDFSYYDPVIKEAQESGLELVAMVSSRRVSFPDGHWIWDNHRGMIPDKENWSRFLKVLTERYKETIRYWEIWSEPNCLACNPMAYYDVDAYAEVLKTASNVIREADGTAKIVSGGIWINEVTRYFLEALLKKHDLKEYFDIFSWHFFLMTPFRDLTSFEQWRKALRGWVRFYRSLLGEDYPIWITEFGVPTRTEATDLLGSMTKGKIVGLTESQQAEWFEQFAEEADKEWQTELLVWICLQDVINKENPNGFNDNLGMLRADGSEKPVQKLVAKIQAEKAAKRNAAVGGK